jgi:hypothetical protein
MKKLLFLALMVVLPGCEPAAQRSSNMGKWELIGETPGMSPMNGIYKLHSDKEKATFYATLIRGDWAISVVKD